jgi:SAM-dependent methyltransferase
MTEARAARRRSPLRAVSKRVGSLACADRGNVVRAQFNRRDRAAAYARSQVVAGPSQRFFASRIESVMGVLEGVGGGDLLDVGCGPGVFLRHLADRRPGDFRTSGVDLSDAMVDQARSRLADVGGVRLVVGSAERLPHRDDSYDVVLAMGVIEYCDVPRALAELARVTREGGTVVVSMLNPLSPYRLWEWGVYWPLGRLAGRIEGLFGRPPQRRHGRDRTGIRALPPSQLRGRLRAAGLQPVRTEFFDVSVLVPPLDRMLPQRETGPRRWVDALRSSPFGRWTGTGYLVLARREASGVGRPGT